MDSLRGYTGRGRELYQEKRIVDVSVFLPFSVLVFLELEDGASQGAYIPR